MYKYIGFMVLCVVNGVAGNTYEVLCARDIHRKEKSLRLHLGCGQKYLKGYVNIDYPSDDHTVQQKSCADYCANVLHLSFPQESVSEIRSHHFFEHFDRPTALALLTRWIGWLKVGGTLLIETPDMKQSIRMLASSKYSFDQRQVIMRHLFGSHEAHWAYHYDGWDAEKFRTILEACGCKIQRIHEVKDRLLANITVTVVKTKVYTAEQLCHTAKEFLRKSLVDGSSSEQRLWHIWCSNFDRAYSIMQE